MSAGNQFEQNKFINAIVAQKWMQSQHRHSVAAALMENFPIVKTAEGDQHVKVRLNRGPNLDTARRRRPPLISALANHRRRISGRLLHHLFRFGAPGHSRWRVSSQQMKCFLKSVHLPYCNPLSTVFVFSFFVQEESLPPLPSYDRRLESAHNVGLDSHSHALLAVVKTSATAIGPQPPDNKKGEEKTAGGREE